MITTYKLFKQVERIDIDIIAAELHISTHASRSVIIDHRKNISEDMMPRVDCYEKRMHIHAQKFSAFMTAKQLFRIKIIVPENITLHCKLFSGESFVSGQYKKLSMHQRSGNCIVNAGYLLVTENSLIENVLGIINIQHVPVDMQTDKSGNKATITNKDTTSKLQIRSHSVPLVFSSVEDK